MFMLWAYRSDACDEGLLLRSVSLPKWFYAKATSERVGVIVFLMDHTCSMHLFGKPRWIWQRGFTSFPWIEQHRCEVSANMFPFFFCFFELAKFLMCYFCLSICTLFL